MEVPVPTNSVPTTPLRQPLVMLCILQLSWLLPPAKEISAPTRSDPRELVAGSEGQDTPQGGGRLTEQLRLRVVEFSREAAGKPND